MLSNSQPSSQDGSYDDGWRAVTNVDLASKALQEQVDTKEDEEAGLKSIQAIQTRLDEQATAMADLKNSMTQLISSTKKDAPRPAPTAVPEFASLIGKTIGNLDHIAKLWYDDKEDASIRKCCRDLQGIKKMALTEEHALIIGKVAGCCDAMSTIYGTGDQQARSKLLRTCCNDLNKVLKLKQ